MWAMRRMKNEEHEGVDEKAGRGARLPCVKERRRRYGTQLFHSSKGAPVLHCSA